MTGKLIVFEGPDCVGKSTISDNVYRQLCYHLNDKIVKRTSFPGKDAHGRLGQLVYQLHHVKQELGINDINTKSLQMLHVAAHIDLIEHQILPWLRNDKIVIMDRHYLSTWIYGKVFGVPKGFLSRLIELEQEIWQEYASPTVMYIVVANAPYAKDIYKMETWQEIDAEYRALFEGWADPTDLYYLFNLERIHNTDPDKATRAVLSNLSRRSLIFENVAEYAG